MELDLKQMSLLSGASALGGLLVGLVAIQPWGLLLLIPYIFFAQWILSVMFKDQLKAHALLNDISTYRIEGRTHYDLKTAETWAIYQEGIANLRSAEAHLVVLAETFQPPTQEEAGAPAQHEWRIVQDIKGEQVVDSQLLDLPRTPEARLAKALQTLQERINA